MQLCKLCGFVVLRGRVHLSVIPSCPGVSPCCKSSSAGGGVLRVVHGSHGPIDVEALPCWVVAVGFGFEVWLSGIEASMLLLRQLLPECGEGVSPRSHASRHAYLGKTWAFSHLSILLPHIHVAREG